MVSSFELIDDLLGGTARMREVGERWMPREPNELVNQYRLRLSRSFLFNALRDTLDNLVSRPFSRKTTVKPDPSEDDVLEDMVNDMDLEGSNLTNFAKDVFEIGSTYGIAYILTDYPVTSSEGTPTLAEERSEKIRPYFTAYRPHDVIGWKSERMKNGKRRMTQVRLIEHRDESESPATFDTKEVKYVRVISMNETGVGGTWQLFRQGEKSLEAAGQGTHTFDEIPLDVVYFKKRRDAKVRYMRGEPPLQDLAEMNLCHWHSSSDQRNALRFTRFGMLVQTGVSLEEAKKPVTVGPGYVFRSTEPTATFSFCESSGDGVAVGENDLKRIEERMELLGLRPLVEATSNSTATGKTIDENKTETAIQLWIRAVEEGLSSAFRRAFKMMARDEPEGFAIDIFSDFSTLLPDPTILTFLQGMRTGGDLSRVTFLEEVKRRGILSPSVDPEAEAEEAANDAPLLPNPFGDPKADPDNPKPDPTGKPPFPSATS